MILAGVRPRRTIGLRVQLGAVEVCGRPFQNILAEALAVVLGVAGLYVLEHLGLEDCELITDASLIEVARACRGLRGLNLRGCRNVTDAALAALGARCSKLEALTLASFCRRRRRERETRGTPAKT